MCILAVGPKRCMYFARLFKTASNFKESLNSTSDIELDPELAALFPKFLDYMYLNKYGAGNGCGDYGNVFG
jgi:hypothetical protein